MRWINKRKNRKGFTLVELLATILILSILMVIAIVSVRSILKNTHNSYYSSQKQTLILAGQSYVQDNRNMLPKKIGRLTKIPFQDLKDKNYIKEILDSQKKVCDLKKSYFQVYQYASKKYSYSVYLVCPNYNSKDETYMHGPDIKIDYQSAYNIAKADITMSDPDKVLSYQYIVYRDGIEVVNSGSVSVGVQKEIRKNISLKKFIPGEIKITVNATDIYGNISTKSVSQIIMDTIPPVCGTITGASTAWSKSDRKISVACTDTESGCTRDIYTKTFKDTKVGTIPIKDNAGNVKNCPVNVYVDSIKPTCTSSGGSTAWTTGSRTLVGTCKDMGSSGCKGNVSKVFNSNINTTTASPGSVFDNAGNTVYCPANQTVRISKKQAFVANGDYYVCPNDQMVPNRNQCGGGAYNTMYVNNVRISTTSVTVHVRLHMNTTYATWDGYSPNRMLCLANSSGTCVINLRSFSIGSSGWTCRGCNPIDADFSFNVSGLAAGYYRIIVDGGSTKFRFKTSPYVLDTIRVS